MTTAQRTPLATLPLLGIGLLAVLLLSTCSMPSGAGDGPAASAAAVAEEYEPTVSSVAPTGVPGRYSAAPAEPSEPVGRQPEEAPDDAEPTEADASGDASAEATDAEEADEPGAEDVAETATETAEEATDLDEPIRPARPARVVIPEIGVDNPVVPVGLHPDQSLVVPDEAHVAGWYTGRPRPGEPGPAILAGHNQWGGKGVFWDLHRLAPGDVIEVHDEKGSVVRFEIDRLEQHPKDDFPTERVYGDTERAELRVITCGGEFDQQRDSHVDNVIAFAVRID